MHNTKKIHLNILFRTANLNKYWYSNKTKYYILNVNWDQVGFKPV